MIKNTLILIFTFVILTAFVSNSHADSLDCSQILQSVTQGIERLAENAQEQEILDLDSFIEVPTTYISLTEDNGRYVYHSTNSPRAEIPPVFHRDGGITAPQLNSLLRQNTMEGIAGNRFNIPRAIYRHGITENGNQITFIEGTTLHIPFPAGYLPNGVTELTIDVPTLAFQGDMHSRARILNYLNQISNGAYPYEGLDSISDIPHVLGNGGIRIVLQDMQMPNAVIKMYDPELVLRSSGTLHSTYQEHLLNHIQREIIIHDLLAAIEDSFIYSGQRPPFHVARLLNRNNLTEIAMGILRYEKSEGRIFVDIHYFPGIVELVRVMDHYIFQMSAHRFLTIAAKGFHENGEHRFVGLDLFRNIMHSGRSNDIPEIFDF